MFDKIINTINSIIWSTPLVILCMGAGIFLSVYLKFPQFRHFKKMLKLTFTHEKSDSGISPFQAFAATVGSRVGMGNIAGVATAIFMGGPGAIFWMWVIALLGAASAFVESTLGQAYKTKLKGSGEFVGGPAYYIEHGLKSKAFAIAFAVATIIGPGMTMPGIQSNSIVQVFNSAFGIPDMVVMIILTVLTGLVVCGGVKRIGKVAEFLAPFMCVIYILMCIIVMVLRYNQIPAAFALIFKSAFGQEQAFSGIIGSMIAWGIKRGVYSNEAGQGSGAIVSSATETSHPVKQGLVQIFSVYVDTLLVCTASALIILLSGYYNVQGADGSLIVNQAGNVEYGILYVQNGLNSVLPGDWSSKIFAVATVLFVFTSLIGYYYEAEGNVNYIGKGNKAIIWVFRAIFLFSVFAGILIKNDALWSMGDLGCGLMAWFNIIAILLLCKKAKAIMKDFEYQYELELNPCFDPKEFHIEDPEGAWDIHATEKHRQMDEIEKAK